MEDNDTKQIVAQLQVLVETTREGLRDVKSEIRVGFEGHGRRLDALESFVRSVQGVLTVGKVILGASFLGSVLVLIVTR